MIIKARSMLRPVTLFLLMVTGAMAFASNGDDRFRDVEITSTPVAENIYMLTGMGGNIGLSIGEDSVVLIDDQFAPLSEKIKKAVADITDKPIQFIINTHWHGDHTGGNENFARDGVFIVAHENVRERLASENISTLTGQITPPASEGMLPVITFNKSVTFYLNGEEAAVTHLSNSHTDGDSIIHFKKSNVIHTGDIFFHGLFPYIDLNSKGSVDGMINSLRRISSMADENTRIIPGHGMLADKHALERDLRVLVTVRDRISKLIAEGKNLEQVKAANPTQGYESYGRGFINAEAFTEILFRGLQD